MKRLLLLAMLASVLVLVSPVRAEAGWGEPVAIGPGDGPDLAVQSTVVHLVWLSGDHRAVLYRRCVGGGYPSAQVLSAGVALRLEVRVAADGDSVHVVWEQYDEASGERWIRYMRSLDGGLTWSLPRNLSPRTQPAYFMSIAADAGRVHVAWTSHHYHGDIPQYAVYYRHSDDSGATWAARRRLSGITSISDMGAIAAEAGVVHVALLDDYRVFLRSSADGGDSWSRRRLLTPGELRWRASPAVATAQGRVHVAWVEGSSSADHVYVRTRAGDGTTWSPRTRLSTAPGAGGGGPILVAAGKRVEAFWNTPDPGVATAKSVDGGASWSAAFLLIGNAQGPRADFADTATLHLVFTGGDFAWHTRRSQGSG